MSVKNTLLNRVLILAAVLFGLTACQTASDPAIKLTADEVRSTFVARAWTQGNGNFMFSPDGQYTYSDSSVKVFGTYQIADDGVLCAKMMQRAKLRVAKPASPSTARGTSINTSMTGPGSTGRRR